MQECVVARAARYTYGTSIDPAYNDNNLEHQVRRGLRFFDCDGRETLRGAFETLVKKVNHHDLATVSYRSRIFTEILYCFRTRLSARMNRSHFRISASFTSSQRPLSSVNGSSHSCPVIRRNLPTGHTIVTVSDKKQLPAAGLIKATGKLTRGVQVVATLAADMTAMMKNVEMKFNRTTGRPYWEVSFQVQVFFGRADIEACIAWYEEVS